MLTLITISIFINFSVSSYAFYTLINNQIKNSDALSHLQNFSEGSLLILIFYLGEIITNFLKSKTLNEHLASNFLTNQQVKKYFPESNSYQFLQVSHLQKNDYISIPQGEIIPVDGNLVSQKALLDFSSLTGENQPVRKQKSDFLPSGIVNLGNEITLQVTKLGNETTINQIYNTLTILKAKKNRIGKIADKASGYFILLILTISVIVFMVQ
jgi:Cu+-exporting ATPase